MANDKQIQNQKELNALQRITMSMTGDMSSMMDDIIASSDKRNKALKEDATITKQILADLKETGDVNKTIAQISTQIGQSKNKEYGVNQKAASLYQSQLIAIKGITTGQKEAAKAAQGVFDVTDEISSKFNNVIDNIDSFTKKIPIIGPALSNAFAPLKEKGELAISRATDGMKNGFIRQLTKAKKAGDSFGTSFKKGVTGGVNGATKAMAGTLAISTALASTLLIAVGVGVLLYKAFQIGLKRFKAIDEAASSFRKETGLLNSQMGALKQNIREVSKNMAPLGVSTEDVANAAGTFSNEMKGTSVASKGVLTSMVAMEKSFGVSASTQAKVNNTFQLMSGVTAETAQSMVQTTIAAAKLAGVAPAAVMQDIAENAEAGMLFFQGSTKALAKAAIEARKMGTSIGETTKVAEGLLDFESSITKELELGAMLGTRVNFNKARALAFEGDMIGMQQAVNAEVSKLGDINDMNMYKKKALMDATGMDLKSLIKQQSIAKKFGSIDKEKLAAANALLDRGMKINDITDEQLSKEAIRLGNQQEMQSEMDTFKNTFSALGVGIADIFTPMVGPILQAATLVGKLLLPIFKVLGSVIKFALAPFTLFIDGLKQAQEYIMGNKKAFVLLSAVMGGILGYQIQINSQKIIGAAVSAKDYLLEKASIGLVLAKNAAAIIGNGILTVANAIKKKGLLSVIAEMAMRAFTSLSAIPVIGPVLGIAGAAAATALGYNYFSKAGDVNSPSDGKTRISTKEGGLFELSPNDDLLAAPGLSNAMANKSDGKSGVGDMIGSLFGGDTKDADVVAKLDELLIVMRGNKDVYMDGKKVTAGVSSTVDKIGSNSYAIV